LKKIWDDNYGVYGRRKLWMEATRAGLRVGRDRIVQLMKELGISGTVRGKTRRTTVPDEKAERPADLVDRNWEVDAPNRLWVTDLTQVATWAGVVYLCFIIDDYSRMIVGWRAATPMRTDMVLDALEHAIWTRDQRLEGSWPTPTGEASSLSFATPNPSPRSAPPLQSGRLVMRSTTPSPNRPSVSTRPS